MQALLIGVFRWYVCSLNLLKKKRKSAQKCNGGYSGVMGANKPIHGCIHNIQEAFAPTTPSKCWNVHLCRNVLESPSTAVQIFIVYNSSYSFRVDDGSVVEGDWGRNPLLREKSFKGLRSLHWANSRLDEFLIWPELNELFLWESCYDVCYLCSFFWELLLVSSILTLHIHNTYNRHIIVINAKRPGQGRGLYKFSAA